MCYAKPGPRCSSCTRKKLNRLKAWQKRNPEAPNIDEKISVALEEYYGTKKGIKELRAAGENEKADAYQKQYDEAIEEYKKTNNGVTTPLSQQPSQKNETSLTIKEQEQLSINKVNTLSEEYNNLISNPEGQYNKSFYANLTEEEIKSNEKLISIGEEVDKLAALYGKPSSQEWETAIEEISGYKETLLTQHNNANKRFQELNASIKRNPNPTPEEVKEYNDGWAEAENMRNTNRKELEAKIDAINKPIILKQKEAYQKALKTLGVEFITEETFSRYVLPADKQSNTVAGNLKEAATYYPSSFLKGIEENATPVVVKQSKARAHMGLAQNNKTNEYAVEIKINRNEMDTAVHELGHYMELNNSYIGNAERIFTKSEQQNSGKGTFAKRVGRSLEQYATDSLYSDYSSRIYSNYEDKKFNSKNEVGNSYEVLSTGMEALFFGNYGGGNGGSVKSAESPARKSVNQTNFVLGILALNANKGKQ